MRRNISEDPGYYIAGFFDRFSAESAHFLVFNGGNMKGLIFLFILTLSSFASAQHGHGGGSTTPKVTVWLDDGLGAIDHPVTTKNPEAQKFFNQGLAYMYAFNHAEGINSFKHAAELDPEMAMAFWGVSLALGSNYNVTADEAALTEAYANLQKALSLAPKTSQADQDFIAALAKRYAKDPKTDRAKLANDYKLAMADLVKKYPDDLDAATLYAESMMNLRPWQLWSLDGKPAEGTMEIIAVLEGVLKRNPKHTGANHYYIHAIEASPNPERALAAANRLLGLAPNAGHLVHMPSHIYLRTGDWDEAVKSNDLAIEADRSYQLKSGSRGLYMMMYYNHNIHMLASSHASNGNYAGSIKAANELVVNVGPNVKAMPMLEMFMPYPIIANVRFNKWDEALAYPQPPAEMLTTTAHWHFARGMAFAERQKTADAEKELAALRATAKKIPAEAVLFTTPVSVALKVADELLSGEIALSKGNRKAAIELMRAAAVSEAKVNYAEPPDWDIPVREWLGRVLMMDGQYAEAEMVYREEIALHPRNGRALFGLAEALSKQGRASSAALVRKEFESAWTNSDTKLTSDMFTTKKVAIDIKRGKVKLKTGIAMNYVEVGDPTGPVVLLIHGYTDSSFSYSRILPLIDKKYRILAIDQRGHGDSDKPVSGYEMRDLAADAAAFMEAVGVRSATVVGHSMGSFVAMQTALDHPAKVGRLVLVGTSSTANNKNTAALLAAVNELKDPVSREFAHEFQVSTSSPDLPKDFFNEVVANSLKLPASVWKQALVGVMGRDYRPELKKIKVPVTIFWGEKETVFSREDQEPLIKGLPNARFVVYPNSGHAPTWDEPEKFAKDLNEILANG